LEKGDSQTTGVIFRQICRYYMCVKKMFFMIIDTKEEASTLRKTKTFVIIVYALLIAFTVFFLSVGPILFFICGALSLFFLLFYWFQYKMEFTYFYFSNNSKNLIFKFYSLRNFYGKPKTIEIPKPNFVKYDIVMSFFDKKDSLILYQKMPKGIAKYQPISITLLNKKQKTELKRTLFAEISKSS